MQLTSDVERTECALGASVRAKCRLPQGAAVFRIVGSIVSEPQRHSIQLGERLHIVPDGQLWGCMNHSCDPNCGIDYDTWTIVTLRPVLPDQELTYNYLTTEWEMASPFECRCNSENCLGWIGGHKFLSEEQREPISGSCSPYIASKRRG